MVNRDNMDAAHRLGEQIGETYQSKPERLKDGLQVVGAQGIHIGTVKEIHAHDFLLSRPDGMDVHVPFSAIQMIADDRAMLNVAADQIDSQHWSHI